MKRRAVILFLCLYIVAAVFAVRMSVHVTGNSTENQTEEGGRADIVATEPPVWRSYEDFLFDEGIRAWDDPTAYIGATATFNIDWISEFVFAPDVDVIETIAADGIDSLENSPSLTDEEIIAVGGEDLKVVVTDYKFVLIDEESETGDLWYKVEAAEGYELPQIMKDNPYVLHLTYAGDMPTLIMGPVKGMFADETVFLQKEAVAAARQEEFFASEAPLFFEVEYLYSDSLSWYDLGDVSDWEAIENPAYHYVSANSIILIPTEVTRAYDRLMAAESSSEYWEILESISDDVLKQFSEAHKTKAESHIEHLVRIENIEYSSTVKYNGVDLEVTVKGKIPETGVSLSVEPVSDNVILEGGFGIKKAEDIITALDIKILNDADGTEWQPEKGHPVQLSIGVAALGCENGDIVQFHHKHGDTINKYDVFLVEDGKVTYITDSFSIYVVNNETSTSTQGREIKDDESDTLYVGQEIIYYFNNNNDGAWTVIDTAGAINYTVYGNVSSESIGDGGVAARWIKIVALRETNNGVVNEPIQLSYTYYDNYYRRSYTETYTINVETPRATGVDSYNENSGRRLYIKDLVNSSGKITAALVDLNGNVIENGLDGAAYSWTRDDGLFIVPAAYKDNYQSVDIARDHGGLVEARMKEDGTGYDPVTYELSATLSDGTVLKEKYTVYYQSEIINAGFEFPNSSSNSVYGFFPNGWSELYWKTTAQGAGDKVSKDIEYGDISNSNGSQFGVTHAADWDPDTRTGVQFAELNAEAFGALYQDIITVPSSSDSEEYIEWNFAHAKRIYQSWARDATNKMFVVIGATEAAQKLTHQKDLEDLGTAAKKAAEAKGDEFNNKFLNCEVYVEVTDKNGATYWVWYHDADKAHVGYGEANNYGWSELEGSYKVPEDQYRTRVFFVSDPPRDRNGNVIDSSKNAGNLIDISKAGQYKHYLIEYYEETYIEGEKQVKYLGEYDEDGTALIYSSEPIIYFNNFIDPPPSGMGDYLHRIVINGSTYPYDIRYSGVPSLYIEKYPGDPKTVDKPQVTSGAKSSNTYGDYDIVVQIFFRDTVIAVQKKLILPAAMTEEQKLTLFNEINSKNPLGYQSQFQLVRTEDDVPVADASTSITQRDPKGEYKGYVALGDNPKLDVEYQVEELKAEKDPTGLVLEKVEFYITRYKMGEELNEDWDVVYEDYNIVSGESERLLSKEFILIEKEGIKVADIKVTNTYGEKMTTIYYQAVGNGKVAITPEAGKDPNFLDTPTEQLAFYSGKATGASVYAGKGASFVGWFKDAECTIPVTAADGVWDGAGNFKPNANIINDTEVTFYAKFASFTIDIERENAAPNQIFVYKVEKIEDDVVKPEKTMYVTLACDEAGKGKVSILEAEKGEYKVTEIEDWSWRYPYEASTPNYKQGEHPTENPKDPLVFTFSQPPSKFDWLNGYSEALKNIWKKVAG